jgi:glycosyltransferase involved in cell wall biosynthesis
MEKMFEVIIPTWNNLNELKKCLQGFGEQTFRDFRVFICVDGSTDGTIEYLKTAKYNFDFEVLVHRGNDHKGRDETRNLSLDKISAKYILMFDSDIIAKDDLLQKHFDLLNNRDCVSVGEVIYENSKENIWALYLQTRGKQKYKDFSDMPAYYLNTQNASFRATYFTELGGQDIELSKSYGGDDTILGYRIGTKFNIPAVFNHAAVGHSVLEKTLNEALNQMREFGAVNLKIIRRKYPEFTEIFRFDRIESNRLRHRLFRLLLRKRLSSALVISINFLPSIINLKIVHFLVFLYIYKGYKTAKR